MMLLLLGILASALLSLFFSTMTYALRDYSRARLEDYFKVYGKEDWLEHTVKHSSELIFTTAVGRLLANILIVIGSLHLFDSTHRSTPAQYLLAAIIAAVISLLFSVMMPTAISHYAGESLVALFVRPLHAMRVALLPLMRLMTLIDDLVRGLIGKRSEPEPEQIEKDILSVVEEGEEQGVVDTQERKMIESVIEFRDTTANQTMTARPEIVAIELGATLEEVKRTIEESGHSRLPVYDGTLDHIVGILYARDLLKHLGEPPEKFDIRSAMRPAVFVPETKPLRDLLREFRVQKVHIAIVLDEYGGTAGLVTIEDILEELVGDISDEHEPQEPAMLRKLGENTFEIDARVFINEVNNVCGLNLPEDAGYDTLGGFVSVATGRIPEKGTVFEQNHARFTVLDAEPQRVKRVRVEVLPQSQQDEPLREEARAGS